MKKLYGIELILDMSYCDTSKFTKENINKYFIEICKLAKMKRHGRPVYWYDHSGIPHLEGISAIQFIETCNIVLHALNILEAVFVNIFSCKDFDTKLAGEFTKNFFGAKHMNSKIIERKTERNN